MGTITNFLVDKLQARVAETLIDDTLQRLKQRSGLLDEFMPIKTYEDDEFLAYVTEQLTPVASFIAPGAEPPVTAHGGFRRLVGELAKLGLSYSFDEETQKRMRKAQEEAIFKNASVMTMTMTDGSSMKGTNDLLVKYIYGHVKGLVQSHSDRLHSMAWEVLQTGQLNIEDARTRVKWSVDFRRPGAKYNHFPETLVDTGNTAVRTQNIWTDFANADGIGLLEDAMETYVLTNGFKPDKIAMSNQTMRNLQRQTTTIERARQSLGLAQVGSVGVSMLKEIMMQNNLPPIVEFDELYQDETTYESTIGTNTIDNYVTNVRFLNDGQFVFLKKGMGERAIGCPEEKKQLGKDKGVISGDASVMVRSYEKTTIPIRDDLQSISMVLPLIYNPKLLYSQKVY